MNKRLLSLLLICVLLAALLPAVSPRANAADTPIISVRVEGLDQPIVGWNPDCTPSLKIEPQNAAAVRQVRWNRVDHNGNTQYMSPGEAFVEKDPDGARYSYFATVYLEPQPGFQFNFSTNGSYTGSVEVPGWTWSYAGESTTEGLLLLRLDEKYAASAYYGVQVDSAMVTDRNLDDVLLDGTVSYDPDSLELYLTDYDGGSISSDHYLCVTADNSSITADGTAIYTRGDLDVLVWDGTFAINTTDGFGIWSEGSVNIDGYGDLRINTTDSKGYPGGVGTGILCWNNIEIQCDTRVETINRKGDAYAISAQNDIDVRGACNVDAFAYPHYDLDLAYQYAGMKTAAGDIAFWDEATVTARAWGSSTGQAYGAIIGGSGKKLLLNGVGSKLSFMGSQAISGAVGGTSLDDYDATGAPEEIRVIYRHIDVRYPVIVEGVEITNLNRADVLGDGAVSYAPAFGLNNAKLHLKNAALSSSVTDAIYADDEPLEIVLEGDSTIHAAGERNMGVFADCPVSISGSGSLQITAEAAAFDAPQGFTVRDYAKVKLESVSTEYPPICEASAITVQNYAKLTLVAANVGLGYETEVYVNDRAFFSSQCENQSALGRVPHIGSGHAIWVGADPETKTRWDGVSAIAQYRYVEAAPETLVNPFTDVRAKDYFYEPVMWAVYHNPQITNGTDATHFSPYADCTREQVAAFLWRAAGCPEPTIDSCPFVDVRKKDYYYRAVLWAVEHNITAGIDATHFGVNQPCTRDQVVTFLWRAAGSPEPTVTENPFVDVRPKDYFYKAVLWAVETGVTTGVDVTHFGPRNTCIRCQVVTFLYRAYMQ